MLNIKNILLTITAISIIATPAESFSLNFLKRGFKHCEGVCDKVNVCKDKDKLEWCILNCSHKMDSRKLCTNKTNEEVRADIEKNINKLSPKEKEVWKQLQEEMSVPAPTDIPKPPELPKK
jgi:hypothetical protein